MSYRHAKKEFEPYFGADSGLNYIASGVAAEVNISCFAH
jgi:hypothetical protein